MNYILLAWIHYMASVESIVQGHPKKVSQIVVSAIFLISLLLAGITVFVNPKWHSPNILSLMSTLIGTLGTVLAIVFSIVIFGVESGGNGYPIEIKNIHFYTWTYYITIFLFVISISTAIVIQLLDGQTPLTEELREPFISFTISFSVLTLFWVPIYTLHISGWRSIEKKLELWYNKQPVTQNAEGIVKKVDTLSKTALAGIASGDKQIVKQASNNIKQVLDVIYDESDEADDAESDEADDAESNVAGAIYMDISAKVNEMANGAKEENLLETYNRMMSLYTRLFVWSIETGDRTMTENLLGQYREVIDEVSSQELFDYRLVIYRQFTQILEEIDQDKVDSDKEGIDNIVDMVNNARSTLKSFSDVKPFERSRAVEGFFSYCQEVHKFIVDNLDQPHAELYLSSSVDPTVKTLDRFLGQLAIGTYELISLHSSVNSTQDLLPAETCLSILSTIVKDSKEWDEQHTQRMSIFYIEAAYLLHQSDVIELDVCVKNVGNISELESMRSEVGEIVKENRSRQFFDHDYRISMTGMMSYEEWVEMFEDELAERIISLS